MVRGKDRASYIDGKFLEIMGEGDLFRIDRQVVYAIFVDILYFGYLQGRGRAEASLYQVAYIDQQGSLHGRDQVKRVIQRIYPPVSAHHIHIVVIEQNAAFQCPFPVIVMEQAGFVFGTKPIGVIADRIDLFRMGKLSQ